MTVDTIMESRVATFFENEFPMKNAPSTTGHELIIPHEHENFTLIEKIEESYVQNPEEDDTIVSKKVRNKGLQSLLVMTILCTLWMTY